jgi:hypothetical protein
MARESLPTTDVLLEKLGLWTAKGRQTKISTGSNCVFPKGCTQSGSESNSHIPSVIKTPTGSHDPRDQESLEISLCRLSPTARQPHPRMAGQVPDKSLDQPSSEKKTLVT